MTLSPQLLKDAYIVIDKFLSKQYHPETWCIAGGFVRDYLLDIEARDVDFYIKDSSTHPLSLIYELNNLGLGKWKIKYNYTGEEINTKHIRTILSNDTETIELIFISFGRSFTQYVEDFFDASISMVLWSPVFGINRTSNFNYSVSKKKIILKTNNTLYARKLLDKFPDYEIHFTNIL